MVLLEKSPLRYSRSHLLFITSVTWVAVFCTILGFAAIAHAEDPPLDIKQSATVDYSESGPQITYETTVKNTGEVPVTGILITDVLPAGTSLLYFSDPEENGWLSSQRETDEGQTALWINPNPLAPDETATLIYVVEIPWQNVHSAELDKEAPSISADGWQESSLDRTIGVIFEQTPPPTSTPLPTATATPQPSRTALPTPTATDTRSATKTPLPATEQATATPEPTLKATQVSFQTTTASPQHAATEDSASRLSIIIIFAFVIVVVLVIVLWFALKKR